MYRAQKNIYENILVLTNFNQVIIPLLGIIFYLWILYTLDVKERPQRNSFYYAIVKSTTWLPEDRLKHVVVHKLE
jgi:formate hydrogenlyase subunit 3/multisubunit Na+/H+ antiporter MnhD subunit